MAAAATLLPFALGTFDASSNSNVAIYWVSLRIARELVGF